MMVFKMLASEQSIQNTDLWKLGNSQSCKCLSLRPKESHYTREKRKPGRIQLTPRGEEIKSKREVQWLDFDNLKDFHRQAKLSSTIFAIHNLQRMYGSS